MGKKRRKSHVSVVGYHLVDTQRRAGESAFWRRQMRVLLFIYNKKHKNFAGEFEHVEGLKRRYYTDPKKSG